MPLDLTTEQKAALRSSRIEAAWLLDLYCEPTALHCSSLMFDFDYDLGDGTVTFEKMGARWIPSDGPVTMGADLEPEPYTITFDASRIGDDSDFIGRFADSTWHQRRARMTLMIFSVGTNFATPIAPVVNWEGSMDFRNKPTTDGQAPRLVLTLESGTFRYLGRNVQTRTDENQQRFYPGDKFFQDMAGMIGKELPWHRSWSSIASQGATNTTLTHSDRIRNYPNI